MFWEANKLKCAAAAVALLTIAGTAAADVLVVRASGPSARLYPAGKKIPANAKINLAAGDMLMVLDGRGTRVFRGPGAFSPTGSGQLAQNSVLGAVTGGTGGRARIGAVRGVGTGSQIPSIWHVDVSKSSTVCVADPKNVVLWREDASRPTTLTVTNVRTGATQKVDFQAGQSVEGWPDAMGVSEGADYRLSWRGAAAPTTLRFKTLSPRPSGIEDTASTFIKNGCQAQLDVLVETVKLPDDPDRPAR